MRLSEEKAMSPSQQWRVVLASKWLQIPLAAGVTSWASVVAISTMAVVRTNLGGSHAPFWGAISQMSNAPVLLWLLLLLPCAVPPIMLCFLSRKEMWLVTYTVLFCIVAFAFSFQVPPL